MTQNMGLDTDKMMKNKGENSLFNEGILTSAFEVLERESSDFLAELEEEPSLAHFQVEYEKLFRTLRRSHNQEKRLAKKCRELNSELVNNAAKVQTTLKVSKEDQRTIESLRHDLDKAWAMADVSHTKELKAKVHIEQLQEEIAELAERVEKGKKLTLSQENSVLGLIHERDALKQETGNQSSEIQKIKSQLHHQRKQNEKIEKESGALSARLSTILDESVAYEAEAHRERERRERAEKDLSDAQSNLEKKATDYYELQCNTTIAQTMVSQLETQLKETKAALEKCTSRRENLSQSKHHISKELEEQQKKTAAATSDLHQARHELKLVRNNQKRMNSEKTQLERKLHDKNQSSMMYRQATDEVSTALRAAENEILSLNKEIYLFKQREEQLQRNIVELGREHNLQIGRIQRTEDKVKKAGIECEQREHVSQSLEGELAVARDDLTKQRATICQQEKDCEKQRVKIADLHNMCQQEKDEVKIRDIHITELRQRLHDEEDRVMQQRQQYELIEGERNRYSRQLNGAQQEVDHLSENIKAMTDEIRHLKEKVDAKDIALVRKHLENQKEHCHNHKHVKEIARMKHLIDQDDARIQRQDAKVRRLTGVIQKMEDDALTQQKKWNRIVNERDILGTQLIRHNNEISLMYEKVKIQQNTLRTGESQYSLRLEDMRLLKLKITDLTQQLSSERNGAGTVDGITRELIKKHRELLREKTKVTALSEELENPVNVHRWRKLEGTDPTKYELIQKIQLLQRQLIKKTEEVVEKDVVIQEQKVTQLELKKVFTRLRLPNAADQLSKCKRDLKEKSRQVEAMSGELNMYQDQANADKIEVERLTQELQEVKSKFYEHNHRTPTSATEDHCSDEGEELLSSMILPGIVQKQHVSFPPREKQQQYTHSGGGGFEAAAGGASQGAVTVAARRRFVGGGFAISHGPPKNQ